MEHILELLEATLSRHPDKVAVSYKDQTYTFRQLCDRAMDIAGRISRLVPGINQPVAVMVSRDADTVLYFLAILFSGNYYVPIDPEMPAAKQNKILNDSCPKILFGYPDAIPQEVEFTGTVLNKENYQEYEPGQLALVYDPDAPAYMVYTSGSTGMPKGVLKSHRAVCSFVTAFSNEFGFDGTEVIGNQTPFFFDASAKDLFLMIYTGARLEIVPSELFMYPPRLIMYLNEHKVTYICWVPTALCMVTQLATFKQVMPAYLKRVFFVGEVFPIKQLRRWIEALPDITYVNLYGSTELAGIGCYYQIDTGRELEKLPIGKALCNCRVFLYDEETKQVIKAPDRIGEVCIASDALALEYYHDPEKTAKVFAMMEVPEAGGAFGAPVKVLKTGDLAYYDEEGNLLFASRKDFQIKLMGRRIELGEIEAAADKMEQIQRCACVFDSEKKKIRMYCELIPDCQWSGKMIREELKTKLSDYMVPSVVKIMEKLPLNANGKIDRNTLKNL